jgi:hypothetical protein
MAASGKASNNRTLANGCLSSVLRVLLMGDVSDGLIRGAPAGLHCKKALAVRLESF